MSFWDICAQVWNNRIEFMIAGQVCACCIEVALWECCLCMKDKQYRNDSLDPNLMSLLGGRERGKEGGVSGTKICFDCV